MGRNLQIKKEKDVYEWKKLFSHQPQDKGFLCRVQSVLTKEKGGVLCMLAAKRDMHSTLPNFSFLLSPVSGSSQLSIAKNYVLTKQ